VRRFSITLGVLIGIAVSGQHPSAQSLAIQFFERYLTQLRADADIPGLSGIVLENGRVVWEKGFGNQDVDAAVAATPSTPYSVGEISQTLGATLLLQKCVEQSYALPNDKVVRWVPEYPEPTTTLADLLSHTAPDGGFRYDPSRFAALTDVIEECVNHRAYGSVLDDELLGRFGMTDSVPGQALQTATAADAQVYGAARLAQYAAVLRRIATPYRVVNRRPARNDVAPRALTAANGLVSSVRDLARFDRVLDDDGVLLDAETRQLAFTRRSVGGTLLPSGLGWFVQEYRGERVVWQFGMIDDAYSSLYLKVPGRRLTLILLANSDGLSAPYPLQNGDVTVSVFARTFLQLLVS
jgi:CubicO group peptidase (beta-lactamase class C family)